MNKIKNIKEQLEKILEKIKGCYWIEYGEDKDALKILKTYISNLLDSTALEEKDNTYMIFGEEWACISGYNRAVAEQHKRIKLVKEGL